MHSRIPYTTFDERQQVIERQSAMNLSTYEKSQRKRTLSIILVITSVAMALFGGINYYYYQSNTLALAFIIASILCLPALWLNLRDRYWLSGFITAGLVFSITFYNLVDGAGVRDPGVVAYPLIILVGGLLFGKPALPIFTFISIISLIIVAGIDSSFGADVDRLIIISILLLAGAGATQAVLENTENDINRIKESEKDLRRALEQLRKYAQQVNGIIETVPEGVLLLDGDHQIMLANQTAQMFLTILSPEQSQEEPLKQVGNFLIGELIHKASKGWQEIAVSEPEQFFEVAARSVQKAPSLSQNWVLVLRDVTLERKQQESLEEQIRMATVGQLATGIAHDFRNILSVISTYSQIVQKRPGVLKRGEYLTVVQDQVKEAARLIDQILDFGRRTIMQRQAIDAAELVENVIVILKRTLPANIAIDFVREPGDYIFNADKGRLQQALMNLAVNARDAMPNGGALTFVLSNGEPPAGLVAGSETEFPDWLSLQVSDTGIGVRSEDLPHIFEPFFTTKASKKGTGLGLAQVYGIVKQHEGHIAVESEPGKGTTFNLYFPTTAEKPVSATSQVGSEVKIGGKIKILLVEDDPLTRKSTEALLKLLGCKVITADNGLEALSLYLAQAETIDLVVSDIVMPEMSGIELYRELQKVAPNLKFLVITGYPLNQEARQLLEQGLIDWIQKPYLAEEMAGKIGEMLGTPIEIN